MTVTAVLLVLLALVSALGGLVLTWVSACCGSPDPVDPTPFIWSLLAAGLLATAGVGLLRGRMRRGPLLALTLVVVGGCFVAGLSSIDLQAVFVVLLVGWVGLVLLLRRPGPALWLAR